MTITINESRKQLLHDEFEKPYFMELTKTVKEYYTSWEKIFPPGSLIFNAFNITPVDQVKVVILWQDPYHWLWQAHWLSFSVPDGVKIPPSLKNIFKEIADDCWGEIPDSWNLTRRAEQWVLLLNAVLTVKAQTPASHKWLWREQFTDAVIQKISQEKEWIVFMLRWKFAQSKAELIDNSKHLVLESTHPSPFSAYKWFLWCGHFSQCNAWLKEKDLSEIERI